MNGAEILVLLARTLASAQGTEPLAGRLCQACVEILGAESGAIALTSPTARLTIASSDGPFSRIEDLEEVLGEGPARLAYTEGRTVAAHLDGGGGDSAAFPMFATMARAIGSAGTLYAVPMRPGGHVVGVLSLYLRSGGLARTVEEAEFLAGAAGAALLGDPHTLDVGSQPSWPERARLHQATGVVVAQLRVAPADALAVLRAHAFGRASSLESVVDDVLARRITFSYVDSSSDDGIVSTEQPRTEEP
jgi:hypothetical protein